MLVHLNGSLLEEAEARISPFDRGFMFGDGVYEALLAFDGELWCANAHVDRWRRSLESVGITGFDAAELIPRSRDLMAANDLDDALVYWQVTRGVTMPRDHLPRPGIRPTVFGCVQPGRSLASITEPDARRAVTCPDIRWGRCDIKSISLIPAVLAKMQAEASGADEALLVRERADGRYVTEAGSTNVMVAFRRGGEVEIATPPADEQILHGVTRRLVMACEPSIVERPIRLEELRDASEVILTGTTTLVAGIVEVDGETVGDGRVGPVTRSLFRQVMTATRDGRHRRLDYA
jgi:D-alanine transaminase